MLVNITCKLDSDGKDRMICGLSTGRDIGKDVSHQLFHYYFEQDTAAKHIF